MRIAQVVALQAVAACLATMPGSVAALREDALISDQWLKYCKVLPEGKGRDYCVSLFNGSSITDQYCTVLQWKRRDMSSCECYALRAPARRPTTTLTQLSVHLTCFDPTTSDFCNQVDDNCWSDKLSKGLPMSQCLIRKPNGTDCTPSVMPGVNARCLKGVCRCGLPLVLAAVVRLARLGGVRSCPSRARRGACTSRDPALKCLNDLSESYSADFTKQH